MSEDKKKIYVGNLPFGVDSDKLAELFTKYGLGEEGAQVISDRYTGRSKGFGFVTLESEEAANKAVEEMHGQEVEGRTIVVNIARPMAPRDRKPDYDRR